MKTIEERVKDLEEWRVLTLILMSTLSFMTGILLGEVFF